MQLEHVEKLPDRMPGLRLVAHGRAPVDRVAVPSPDAFDRHEAGLDEVGDDPLRGALGDAHHLGDVPRPYVWVLGDAEKHLGVVRHEPPALAIDTI